MKTTVENVIIGTKLDPESDPLVMTGTQIAAASGATIHLVHAFENPALIAGGPFEPVPWQASWATEDVATKCRERMEEQIGRLRLESHATVARHIVQGSPHKVLIDIEHGMKLPLLVVGRGKGVAARVFGSTASRLVRKADCPVMAVCGTLPLPVHSVLMPVDLSEISGEVVARAQELLDLVAEQPEAVAIEALYVLEPRVSDGFVPEFYLEQAQALGRHELAEFLNRTLTNRWHAEVRVLFGGARDVILDHLAVVKPDLVVMGTHGLGGFDRFMMGSVAEAVVRAAERSVLVIPPRAAQWVSVAGGDQAA